MQLTKTVTNNSSEQADVFLTQGFFVTLQPDGDNRYTSGRDMLSEAIWRSGHDGPAWESHYYFQMMEPGETREVSVLYVISDEMLANPGFSFVYYGHEDMPACWLSASEHLDRRRSFSMGRGEAEFDLAPPLLANAAPRYGVRRSF